MTDPILTERAELDDLLLAAFRKAGPQFSVAAVEAESALLDAVQAHHPLASAWMGKFLLDGITAEMRKVVQKSGVIDEDGNIVKTIAGIRRMVNGVESFVQVPLWDMTVDELREHKSTRMKQGRAARRAVREADRLLSLIAKAPGATTAAEAADALGVSVTDVLAGRVAA